MHYLHLIAVSGKSVKDAYAKAQTLLEAGLTLSDGGFDYYTILGAVSEKDKVYKKEKDFDPEYTTTELIKSAVLRWIQKQTDPNEYFNKQGREALFLVQKNKASHVDWYNIKVFVDNNLEFKRLLERMEIEEPPVSLEYFTGENGLANTFNIFEHSWMQGDFASNGLTVGNISNDETKFIVFVDCHS